MFYSIAGSAALLFPFFSCRNEHTKYYVLSKPRFLSNILDSVTISSIGLAYQKKFPSENNKNVLATKMLIDRQGRPLPFSADTNTIHATLDEYIRDDFEQGRIVILNGWILSQTEARQCAFFAMNKD